MGNLLGDVGLFSRGMRAAEMDTANLEQQKQATRRGALGLEDVERGAKEQESLRSAIQGNQSIHGSLIAQAEALRNAGNPKWQEAAKEAMQLPQRNADQVAEAVMGGANPEQVEAIAERNLGVSGMGFDKGSLRIENVNGNLILNATKNGQPLPPRNITEYYAKKQKPVTLSEGQVMINPVTGQSVASNIQPKAGASDGFTYMQTGPQAGTIVGEGKPKTSISITRTEDGEQAQKDLPMFKAVAKSISGHPDMATFDAYGNEILTPEGNIKASIANQIAQTNRNLDPATIANIAIKGRPVVDKKTGEKAIEYKGKYYRYAEGAQAQPQQSVRETTTTRGPTANFACGGKVDHKGIR